MILIVKHVSIEGPGTLGEFFSSTAWETEVIELEKGGRLPEDISRVEALIVLGGPMNVYEEKKYPYLKEEDGLLKEAIREEIPTLGICLGSQLLAKAAGVRVERARQKEIGWYKVELNKDAKEDSLLKGLDSELEVFQWHEDYFENPKDGVLLAINSACRNQAFRVGNCAWGLQFHPEMTAHMLAEWLNYYQEDGIDSQRLMYDFFKKKHNYQRQAYIMYINFARVIDNCDRLNLKMLEANS